MQNAECKMHNKTNKRANPNRQTADLICGAPGGDKKVLAGLCRTTRDYAGPFVYRVDCRGAGTLGSKCSERVRRTAKWCGPAN